MAFKSDFLKNQEIKNPLETIKHIQAPNTQKQDDLVKHKIEAYLKDTDNKIMNVIHSEKQPGQKHIEVEKLSETNRTLQKIEREIY